MAGKKVIPLNPEIRNLPRKERKTALDEPTKYSNVDLLKHIDDDHIIKKIALSISECKFVAYPSSTAFLVLISVFSGYACRAYKVERHHNDAIGIPLGIYAVCEQPSGSAKDMPIDMISNCFGSTLRDLQKNTLNQKKELSEKIEKRINDGEKKDSQELKELARKEKELGNLLTAIENYSLDISDATAEGVEASIMDSGGHFILASSEQELFDVLLCGLHSSGKTNKGLMLKGFDGGRVTVKRQGRKGYTGIASGSFTLFSQPGSMQKLFDVSGYTGLSERFLKLFEPNRGGKRDFVNGKNFNYRLLDDLKIQLQPLIESLINPDSISSPKSFYDLPMLTLSRESESLINHFRNEMESTLDVGGVYFESKVFMMGALTKCNIQTQKMASCLHLLDGGYYDSVIAHKHVISAINIIRDILMSYSDLFENKGMLGNKAYYEKIISYLSKSNKMLTETDIAQNLKGTRPFDMENSYRKIRETVANMLEDKILKEVTDTQTGSIYVVVV